MNQMPPAAQAAPAQPVEEEMYVENEAPMEGPMINGEELQGLLFSRFQQLSPMEMRVFDSIITPQTIPVLFKLFPEMGIILDQGSQVRGMGQGAQPEGAQAAPEAPVDNAVAADNHPLIKEGVSRGLMG